MDEESAVLGKDVSEFVHQYDFGDDWQHRVGSGSLCVADERTCPPEDVGGTYGYRPSWKRLPIHSMKNMCIC